MTAEVKKKKKVPTFFFSPEYKGPERSDNLKLVVSESSHLPDGSGQDQTFGVHLLNKTSKMNSQKHTRRDTQRYMQAKIIIKSLLIPVICISKHTITVQPVQHVVCMKRCVVLTCVIVSWD